MGKLDSEKGAARALLLLLILIVIAGGLYLARHRNVDMTGASKSVVVDLENAAKAVRETSQDAILTAKVKTALALSKSASAFDVKVESDEGVVTLTGSLPSDQDKEAVLKLARDTDGVASVVDRIIVDPKAARVSTDEEVQKRVEDLKVETAIYERLLSSDVDARGVRVSVSGGVVHLTGSISDSVQKGRVR